MMCLLSQGLSHPENNAFLPKKDAKDLDMKSLPSRFLRGHFGLTKSSKPVDINETTSITAFQP